MRVRIGSRSVTLTDDQLLGVGGEANVYRHQDHAVKIFHAPTGAKIAKLRDFPTGLPKEVVAPEALVLDDQGAVIGFTMPAIDRAHELALLARRRARQGLVTSADVVRLFVEIHRVLEALHALGVVVGDLNDGNVLFAGTRPWFIDADSMQVPGHLCPVGHERFIDPLLYGADLTRGPAFSADTDWYAFSVLLFSALLYVHPYGGVHPRLPTFLRRAEAQVSVFDPEVKYPKGALQYRILPDALLDHFDAVFQKRRRGLFPKGLLDVRFTQCRCGLEHARRVCPDCASISRVAPKPRVVKNNSCRAIPIFRTQGQIIAAVKDGGLAYLHLQDGLLRREDGSRVMEAVPELGMRFLIAGAKTWVQRGDSLVCVHREKVVDRAASSTFAASAAGTFAGRDGYLVELGSGMRVGKIAEGLTWAKVGARLGFGFYRAGRTMVSFLFRPGRAGFTHVDLPAIDGRLVDQDVVFDEGHALVSFLYDRGGQRRGALYLIGADGRIIGQLDGPADGFLERTGGRCLSHGRMLVATDAGLVALSVDGFTQTIVETAVFTDTEPFVTEGAELLPGPEGSVYVVNTNEITQLTTS